MPDNNPNKSEQLLKKYAAARRQKGESGLHPATRKMLQAEVARTYGSAEAGSLWARWRAFWPQFAMGGAFVLILIGALVAFRAPRPQMAKLDEDQLLRKNSAPEPGAVSAGATLSAAPPAADAPTVATEVLQDRIPSQMAESERVRVIAPTLPAAVKNEVRRDSPAQKDLAESAELKMQLTVRRPAAAPALVEPQEALASNFSQAPEAQGAANVAAEPAVALAVASAEPARERALQVSSVAGAAVPTVRYESLGRASQLTNLGNALRLDFVALPASDRSPSVPALLHSFQVEQHGEDLRFLDKDGSIYTGHLMAESAVEKEALALQPLATQALGLPGLTQNSAIYYFQARGTNRSLAAPVTIVGRLLENTNSAADLAQKLDATPVAKQTRAKSLFKRVILGQATIGQTNQVAVKAVSVQH